jgi:hypothetical protein
MPDINWGGDSSTAPFSSRLDEANGDLILAEDNSGGTVLLEYDGTTWQYRGPVEMNGEDISGVGTLTATDATISGTVDAGTVNAEDLSVNNVGGRAYRSVDQTIPTDDVTQIGLSETVNDDSGEFSLPNNEFVAKDSGFYIITGTVTYDDFAPDSSFNVFIRVNGVDTAAVGNQTSITENDSESVTFMQRLNADDRVGLFTFQASGNDQTVQGGLKSTHLSVAQIG